MIETENSLREISAYFDSQQEWLLRYKFGKTFALKSSEIETEISNNKLLFSFLDEKGFQTWRVKNYEIKNERLSLDLTRNFGKENASVTLIPRVSAKDLGEAVELARLEKANQIARIIAENQPKTKLVRASLNKENGRIAQIIFETSDKLQIAAISDVSESLTPEILLSTAISQLVKLQKRKKNPIDTIWIIAEKNQSKKIQKLHALLRENWKGRIRIFEILQRDAKTGGEKKLNALSSLRLFDLWRGKAREIKLPENPQVSRAAREIIKIAPDEIDAIFSRGGETLRFRGLPFARVRKIFDKEKVWFGIEKNRRILTNDNLNDLLELVKNLQNFRRFDSPNKRHEFYRLAPEAWLEAILRQNIKLLDANLILSPLYHQFRAERDKIDLLALRRDGRLVIIELKIAPDREMIFQAIDYWRKIESQRRKGNLRKARLFGDLEIADKPSVCYLVAPTLSFHRDFRFLAGTVTNEIEIHRFNLAENWRGNLKVLNREKLTE